MRKPFKSNEFLPAAIQSNLKTAETPQGIAGRGDSREEQGDKWVWETPWSSAGESEPGWWQAFALAEGVRATRTPDRFIKKQPDTNVVALPAGEGMDAARLARAADRSCEEAIHTRLERLRAAVESRSTEGASAEANARPLATPQAQAKGDGSNLGSISRRQSRPADPAVTEAALAANVEPANDEPVDGLMSSVVFPSAITLSLPEPVSVPSPMCTSILLRFIRPVTPRFICAATPRLRSTTFFRSKPTLPALRPKLSACFMW